MKINCPGCKFEFEVAFVSVVIVDIDAEKKEDILLGKMNVFSCSRCSKWIRIEELFIYCHTSRDLLAFVYSKEMQNKKLETQKHIKENYDKFQKSLQLNKSLYEFQPFILFGMDHLCDLIKIDDRITDEVEAVKEICFNCGMQIVDIGCKASRKWHIPQILPINTNLADRLKHDHEFIKDTLLRHIEKILPIASKELIYYSEFADRLKHADVTLLDTIIEMIN